MTRNYADLDDGRVVVFGWDNGQQTFWLQLWASRDSLAEDEQTLEETGNRWAEHPTPDTLPYLNDIQKEMLVGQKEATWKPATPLQMMIRDLFEPILDQEGTDDKNK